jgi:hypothetical protein
MGVIACCHGQTMGRTGPLLTHIYGKTLVKCTVCESGGIIYSVCTTGYQWVT